MRPIYAALNKGKQGAAMHSVATARNTRANPSLNSDKWNCIAQNTRPPALRPI